jgi:aminoglycoside phosphotransferase (APT) family kinase protein
MAAGADIGLAERVLEAITPVHALPIDPGWELHLPKWGQGTREATRRHVRRVTRFDRRRQACIEAWGHASDRSWLASLSDHLLATMESDCTTVTVGPPRVLHGDLHGDNLRIAGSAIALLDWQSTSLGPPVIDTVNWLALHSTLATAEACLSLGQLHLEAVSAWPGLDVWHAAMRLSLSSLMSGYATRGPDVVSQREAVYVRQQLSRDGLAGVLHASLQKGSSRGW